MRINKRTYLFCFLLIVILQPNISNAGKKQKPDSTWNEWNFRVAPYFWFIGFKGEVYRPPQPAHYPIPPPPKYEIDVGFKDIRNSIKFALMLTGQYRNKHFVTQFNISSLIIESEVITPFELLLQGNVVRLTYVGGDFGAGYRIIKKPKFELDALIGLKFVYFKIGLNTEILGKVPIEGERDHFWFDPVIATNILYRPLPRVEIIAYGDLGAALINREFTYQFMGGVNYLFTKLFYMTLGYRLYYVEVPEEKAIYSGRIGGPILRIGFQF